MGIRRVTLVSAAGVGIVVLQAAMAASAANAATEPAEGGTGGGTAQPADGADTQGVQRTGFGLAFGVPQSVNVDDHGYDDDPIEDIIRIGDRGDGRRGGTGDLIALLQPLHRSGRFSGGDGHVLGVLDGGHRQRGQSGGDATVIDLLGGGNNPRVATSSDHHDDGYGGLLSLGNGRENNPIQLGGGGEDSSRGTLVGLGDGGDGGPRRLYTANDRKHDKGLLQLGNGLGGDDERDGTLIGLGNGADGGRHDSGHAGRGGLIWLLNAAGPALRDGKLIELFNGPPRRPIEVYTAAAKDRDLEDGLLSLGNSNT